MLFEYVGNLHVHSTYSDGTGTIEQIAASAHQAGIDFVLITDHGTLQGLKDGKEKWYNNVLVLIGSEINSSSNHYLALDIKQEIPENSQNPQQVIDEVNEQSGFGFIAHPHERGSRLVLNGNHYPWQDWAVSDFTGIEIWNYSSQFRDHATSLVNGLYYGLLNPNGAIKGPDPQTLKMWDLKAGERPVVAIGGSDAHAVQIRYGPFQKKIFPYEFLFRGVNTHVLLEKPLSGLVQQDKKLIYEALKKGHCFVALDFYRSGKNFNFSVRTEDGRGIMGDALIFNKTAAMEVNVPVKAKIRLLHNGRPILEKVAKQCVLSIDDPGVYRVEAFLKVKPWVWKPWLYSNSIYINQ